MITENDLGKIVDLLRQPLNQMTRIAIDEAFRKMRTPMLMSGSVLGQDPTNGACTVLFDVGGDPVTCASLVGTPDVNARVMVLCEPPSQMFVIGYIGAVRRASGIGGYYHRQAVQSCVNGGVGTVISWDLRSEDSSGFMTTLPGATFTVPSGCGGRYLVSATGEFVAGVGASRAFIAINGPTSRYRESIAGAAGFPVGNEGIGSTSGWFIFNDGDTFNVSLFQTTGAAVNFTAFVQFWRVAD